MRMSLFPTHSIALLDASTVAHFKAPAGICPVHALHSDRFGFSIFAV